MLIWEASSTNTMGEARPGFAVLRWARAMRFFEIAVSTSRREGRRHASSRVEVGCNFVLFVQCTGL